MQDTIEHPQRAFLVGIQEDQEPQAKASLAELAALAVNLDLQVCGSLMLRLKEPKPDLLIGKGNAATILAEVQEKQIECLVFDTELSPVQMRNWEQLTDCLIIDRPGVIIGIFSRRAQTHEARLQVELALLQYQLPRLARSYGHLSRQRGGLYGTKGSGETRIELDRRRIRDRIAWLRKALVQVMSQRELLRQQRQKQGIPVIALAGYTNAGKSSLHRILGQSDTMVKDALFATLDPSTRSLRLPGGRNVVVVDTVGFIRNLPHKLVEAFKATLEEIHLADVIVHVLDASDPDVTQQNRTTLAVLEELEASSIPRVEFLNKWDLLESSPQAREQLDRIHLTFPGDALRGSALHSLGIEELKQALAGILDAACRNYTCEVPMDRGELQALVYRHSRVMGREEGEGHVCYRLRADRWEADCLTAKGLKLTPADTPG